MIKDKILKMNGDFRFAYVTDTRLSDSGETSAKEISEIDSKLGFECIVHGGNALNGNNPEKISMRLLSWELEKYRSSIKNGKILPVQGEKDGWRDERFTGQLALNMMTDDVWHQNTSFVDGINGVSRPDNKPYYYIDFPGKGIINRSLLIFL